MRRKEASCPDRMIILKLPDTRKNKFVLQLVSFLITSGVPTL